MPLGRARELEPDKDSIREAYGRALFGAQRYSEAAEEFEAVVEHAPTNDYALFCLGAACSSSAATRRRGTAGPRGNLRPERADYRHVRRASPGGAERPEAAARHRAPVVASTTQLSPRAGAHDPRGRSIGGGREPAFVVSERRYE